MSDIPGNVENVSNLLNHPAFDLRNPNKASDFSLACMCVNMHKHVVVSFLFSLNLNIEVKVRYFVNIGTLAHWRILWIPCEFPRQRWVRLQVLG